MTTGYKLLTYSATGGPKAGVLIGERVHDAAVLTGNAEHADILAVLRDWSSVDPLLAGVSQRDVSGGAAIGEVRLLAPIPNPGQIWAAGANYQDHIGEMEDSQYKAVNAKKISGGRPWHFMKSGRGAVIGPDTIHPLPHYSQMVDWEIELAVVIGREAYRVSAGDALDYVAGYTIANDLSARDFVARDGIEPASPFRYDWLSHKGFQGSCPTGPWMVPARYIPDPHNLDMKLWVDDELMQDSNTRHMIFNIGEQIEEISARITMYPGDIVLTGTPSGVGMSRGIFLKSGQGLRLWIDEIGEIRHSFT
jgi:2-keto-4-pentenoate hydratase/2-oxohepta-3-ene-1,7-dioic acid hydratase in catechol pathway